MLVSYINKGIIKTKINQKNLSDRIIRHLLDKNDHKDDLSGITLFIYENEVKELSGEVMNSIGILLSKGLIKEAESSTGKKYYLLSDNHSFK
jgi:hypothetical protein